MDSSSASSPSSLPELSPAYAAAIKLIDEAHAQDPNKTTPIITSSSEDGKEVPYELHYARKMTKWLALRCPDASPALQVACRAQHFKRWELPRSTFPPTRAGYLTWRAKQKSQAASQVKQLLLLSSSATPSISTSTSEIPTTDLDRIAALINKQGLSTGDTETQILEDVACLVFLDDQFDQFEQKSDLDEEKVVRILQKTWAKMSPRGREMALAMEHSERAKSLLGKALGDGGKE